jgi:hypothetical protein
MASQALHLPFAGLQAPAGGAESVFQLVHQRGLLGQRLAQAVHLIEVGHRRHPILLDGELRLLAVVPILGRLLGLGPGRSVSSAALPRLRLGSGRRCLETPEQILLLGLERGDAVVALRQGRLPRGQLLESTAQLLAQPDHPGPIGSGNGGLGCARQRADLAGQGGDLLPGPAGQVQHRSVSFGQSPAQASHLLVERDPRLGVPTEARAQLHYLLGLRARDARQAFGLPLHIHQPAPQVEQLCLRRLVGGLARCRF